MTQMSAFEYIRQGQTPFFRLPSIDRRATPAGFDGVAAVLVGVPYDSGVTYQPGARFAPYHVRRVSALVQSFHPLRRVDVFSRLRAVDGGNIAVSPFSAGQMRERIELEVTAIAEAGAAPVVVGGDHSVTLPILRALAERHGPLAVVHVDAHLDTSGPEVWGDAHHHGTPIRHALAEGLIEHGQLHQIGIRATWGTPQDGTLVLEHEARMYDMDLIARDGVRKLLAQVRSDVGDRPLYLTFDVDAVDPAFAPGTGTPVPGGLSAREALEVVRGLEGTRLVGMDVVEVAPGLDHADLTCHLAAHLIYEGLATLAQR